MQTYKDRFAITFEGRICAEDLNRNPEGHSRAPSWFVLTWRSAHPERNQALHQRLALLKQKERELRILFTQSHASLNETQEIETKLVALVTKIAELESAISPEPAGKKPPKSAL